ncbi:unnamed protein product [Arctia plantaginis]|uniref:Uncharacterized protein n=1 Tax=Arctia plantaginis TaxID=874455 RepID=A0A8S1BKI3_ARCPL|nr:unnamed protein product [Arctia plantaginis]
MIENKGRRYGENHKLSYSEITKMLREDNESKTNIENVDLHDDQAHLIEKELIGALANKKSALLDKPFIESQGRNDFLVLHPAFRDPHVTVIPNMIYYNIEKRCVNWLDDCNLHGMKARLLRQVQSPYKK